MLEEHEATGECFQSLYEFHESLNNNMDCFMYKDYFTYVGREIHLKFHV